MNRRKWVLVNALLLMMVFGFPAIFKSFNEFERIKYKKIRIGNLEIVKESTWFPICSSESWICNELIGKDSRPSKIFWNTGYWWLSTSKILEISFYNHRFENLFVKDNFSWGVVMLIKTKDIHKSVVVLQPYSSKGSLVVVADDMEDINQFISGISQINIYEPKSSLAQ